MITITTVVKTAWDATNNWFDRAYKYDHAGRLKEASTYRRARGLTPYPTNPQADPYYQNISYDAFNHTSRTGLLYTGQPSDVGTWVNNRRTGSGWQYDADGNTIVDPNFTQTFDSAGKPSHSVSFARVGDGINYPYQPDTDIAQTYDGSGAPGKRIQISRQPDLFDSEAPPTEDIQTTYYVRSTVLGAAVVELNGPGSMDTVNIYAGGQRISRDVWGSISFEHTNPVTGSRVTSAGHSTYRATTRQERDSFGAEIPNSNPYPSSQSYADYKFGEDMYILGGDPFDYSTGREIDGIPVSEAEFQRRVENGSVVGDVSRGGRYLGSLNLEKYMFLSRIAITFDVFQPPLELDEHPELWPAYYVGSFTEEVELNVVQTKPKQKILPLPLNLKERIAQVVNKPNTDCADFIKRLISEAESIDGEAHSSDPLALFERVQKQASFKLKNTSPFGAEANKEGNKRVVYINPVSDSGNARVNDHSQNAYAVTALNELMHHARESGFYTDRTLARAIFHLLTPAEQKANQLPKSNKEEVNSRYFHPLFNQHCKSPTGH